MLVELVPKKNTLTIEPTYYLAQFNASQLVSYGPRESASWQEILFVPDSRPRAQNGDRTNYQGTKVAVLRVVWRDRIWGGSVPARCVTAALEGAKTRIS